MPSKIIILRGPAGVGKSTLAALLKERLGDKWAHLDIDKLKHVISKDSGDIRSRIAHDVGIYFIEQLLANNLNIIIEEIFREEYYKKVLGLLKAHQAVIHKYFLAADVDTLMKRNNGRAKVKDAATIQKLHKEIRPFDGESIIDTATHSTAQAAELIMKDLELT